MVTFETKKISKAVQNKLFSSFPEMDIEIHSETLFFPQISLYSLFNRIATVNFDITVQREDPLEKLKNEWSKSLVRNSASKKMIPSAIQGKILAISTDAKSGIVSLTISITQRAKEGEWKRVGGIKKIKVVFVMANGIADPKNGRNIGKADVLLAKKDDKIAFLPQSKDSKTGVITVQSLFLTSTK